LHHRCDRCPVPGLTAPAPRIALARLLIERAAAGEQCAILPGMALSRRDIADAAVMVLVVIYSSAAGIWVRFGAVRDVVGKGVT
jgi:hypothetical protein